MTARAHKRSIHQAGTGSWFRRLSSPGGEDGPDELFRHVRRQLGVSVCERSLAQGDGFPIAGEIPHAVDADTQTMVELLPRLQRQFAHKWWAMKSANSRPVTLSPPHGKF